jgi:Uncharacterised nucleotidyltransferase
MITAAGLSDRMSPEQRLLLRAVLLDGEPASTAWLEWRASVDLDDIDGYSNRLLPLLARRLSELAPEDDLRARVRGIYRHTWAKNQLLWLNAAPVLEAFRAADVPVLLLKGAALVEAYGGDWGTRPMYDVDVLVPPSRAGVALDVLATRGWAPEQSMTYEWIRSRALPRRHAWGFQHDDEGRLDLHWHAMPRAVGPSADVGFWRSARPLEFGGLRALALDVPNSLLQLLVHGAGSGPTTPPVQWVADGVLVMRTADPAAIADTLAGRAREFHVLHIVEACLEVIVDLLDEPAAKTLLARVTQTRPTTTERATLSSSRSVAGIVLGEARRYTAGDTGTVRGTVALATDRLGLPLAARRNAAIAYGATGRLPIVARAARRLGGSFVRSPTTPPEVGPGTVLDFTDPSTADRHAGPGWDWTGVQGAETRGAEARLVLPLAAAACRRDLVLRLTLQGLPSPTTLDVFANESRCARVAIGTEPTTTDVRVPASVAQRFAPLELSLRTAPGGRLRRRGRVRARLLRVELS